MLFQNTLMTVSGSGDVVPEVIYLHIDGGGVPRSDDRPDIFIIRHPLFVVGQKLQSLKHFRRETIFIQILEGDIRVLDNIVEEADYFLVLGLPGDANGEGMESTKILELNPNHAVFGALKAAFAANDTAKIDKYAELLYDQALLIEGLPLEDPVAYAQLVCELMK